MTNEQFEQNFLQSDNSDNANRTSAFQNLITYELHRCSSSGGFGFDLKGDRPAIIGSVRKCSIAEQAGLKEGDLVISINNKKVTDLDHDQVVRLVGLSKNKLTLQVTKLKKSCSKQSGKKVTSIETVKQTKKTTSRTKAKGVCQQPTSSSSLQSRIPFLKPQLPPPPMPPPLANFHQLNAQHRLLKQKQRMMLEQQRHIPIDPLDIMAYPDENCDENININNTKTTEEEDEDESDYDYDLYMMTGRRRHNRHHHKEKLDLTDHTNFTADSSQTGDSMPSINLPNERKNLNYENADNLINAYDKYNNGIELEREEELENSDDFFDYDDDFTEDTVSTEDTEDNIYSDYRSASNKLKMMHKPMLPNQMAHKIRSRHIHQAQSHSNATQGLRERDHHKQKKSSRSRHRYPQVERYSNVRIQSTYKRSHKNSQNSSPANMRTSTKATSSRSSKSQAILPPPILTSTFQLQSTSSSHQNYNMNNNYVNIPQQSNEPSSFKKQEQIKKHPVLIENNISIDSEIEEFNNDPNSNNELELREQIRQHHRQQQKKNIQLQQQQQDVAYAKQLKYSNKLINNNGNAGALSNNINPSHLQQNYQNLNYNIDYQNYEPFAKTKNLIPSDQHLKHIENVYKHSNLIQHNNGALSATNLGIDGSNNSIDCINSFNNNSNEQDAMINSSVSSSNLYYVQKTSRNYFESIDENSKISVNDKFSINTTSDMSRDLSQNENIQPIKSYLIKQNMNMNMSKIANIKHFNLNNNNLQNIIKSSNSQISTNSLQSGLPATKTMPQSLDPASQQKQVSHLARQESSCLSLASNSNNTSAFKQLNVNDLYAILKPVIKPQNYDPNMTVDPHIPRPLDFNMLFMGALKVPYDTLCNASKLSSIRKSIEYFLFQDRAENYQNVFVENHTSPNAISRATVSQSTLVSLQIGTNSVKILNKSNKSTQNSFFANNLSNERSVIYSKSQIGFCGKIKENCQFFALVILSTSELIASQMENNKSINENSSINEENSTSLNEGSDNKGKKTSTCCLIFRYIHNTSQNTTPIELILNEIAYIYRNHDCVFNIGSNNLANDCNQETSQSPRHGLSGSANSNMIKSNASPNQLIYDHVALNANVNASELQLSENMKIIKTNLNYMNLNNSSSNIAISRPNSLSIERESSLILNKQTNDIYFNRVTNDGSGNSPDCNYTNQQSSVVVPKSRLPTRQKKTSQTDRNGMSVNSSTCSSTNNLSTINVSCSMNRSDINRSNTSSHINDHSNNKLKSTKNKSSTKYNMANSSSDVANAAITSRKSPKKLSSVLNSELKKSSSSSLGYNSVNNKLAKNAITSRISSSSHKNFKSDSLTTATFLKTMNTCEKKFQRNTEHTQSIKLIKENFASLFLSKKGGTSLKTTSGESNGSSSSNLNTESSELNTKTMSKFDIPDDELLRAIEFETIKNVQQKKKKESDIRGSSASLTNSEPGTHPATKVSLSNRLSARFSTSRPKKSNSHQAFNFLRSKTTNSQTNSTDSAVTDKKDSLDNNDDFLCEEEDFFDADQVINSIDFPAPSVSRDNNCKAKVPSSGSATKPNSRLSLPNNQPTTYIKPSTSKRLFSLISGGISNKQHQQQQQQKQQIDKQHQFQSQSNRRLSDFHRPTKNRSKLA